MTLWEKISRRLAACSASVGLSVLGPLAVTSPSSAAAPSRAVVDLPAAVHSRAPQPTFTREVAPILFKNCVNCHRDGEVAGATPLFTYEAAKRWARAIEEQVVTRAMPPWPADPKRSMKFRNEARLDQRDIDTIRAWVEAGAPKGDDADLPPLPPTPPKWLHPNGLPPDAVLSLPEIEVAATGEIPYVQQRVKVPLSADKWIVAMQVRPGNAALVHHMGITEVALAGAGAEDLDALTKAARQMGIADDALIDIRPAVIDPQNHGAYDMLGVYTPGTTFEMYAQGSAKLLKAGSNLYVNFNIHYTTTGKPEKSRSELALWFQPHPPQHQLFRTPAAVATLIANGRELLTDDAGTKAEGTDVAIPPIAPYADNYELDGITAYPNPITIYQLQPHAHMRGKDFVYSVVYPDGHEVTVLTVAKYDFHWQLAYDLETPLELPAGSKLVVIAHYDNSSKNKHMRERGVDPRNCGPDKVAYFRKQNQSWHEMFSPLVQYSIETHEHSSSGAAGPLPVVQVTGCLARSPTSSDPSRMWVLRQASEPVAAETQSTSSSVLRSLARSSAGSSAYRLLGIGVFSPSRKEHRRVAVKGVLIKDESDIRINVTSLEPIAGVCL